ncbi:MAG: hypothetical protein J6G98_01045 [Bacilli bacterium]|nr:hypothetical protein [Bacilli bacterium]
MKKNKKLIMCVVVFIGLLTFLYLDFSKKRMKVDVDGDYSALVNDVLKMLEKNLKQNNLKYETEEYKNDNIYSFLVKVKDKYPYFISYNIDLKTKESISSEELYSRFNITKTEATNKVVKRLLKFYNEEVDAGYISLDKYSFEEYLSYYRGIEEIEYCYILVVKNNKLYAYINFENNNQYDKEYFSKLNIDPYIVEL